MSYFIAESMSEQHLSIKNWAEDDRPREKLLQKGVAVLSTNELLAILLRSGVGGESAIGLSRRILNDCGNDLNQLARLGVRELMNKYKGVGVAKAAAVIAAIELGRRRKTESDKDALVIISSKDVYYYIQPLIGDLDHEEFWVIFLNNANRIIGSEKLFSGGMETAVVDVRILFRKVLDIKASSIIVAHNHPSGRVVPSTYDGAITHKIRKAGEILDIRLFDHIIVGGSAYYSFADEGKLSGC